MLVTGAGGYLGGHIVRRCRSIGCDCIEFHGSSGHGVGCDLCDQSAVARAFEGMNLDVLIHCAAFVPKCVDDYSNSELAIHNATMLRNVLAATDCPIAYVSSMTVYGRSPVVLRCEEDAGFPESPYGASKYQGEIMLRETARDSYSIRLPGLFGGIRRTGLVANTMRSLARNLPLDLPKTPLLWAAMDVQDAADAIVDLSLRRPSGAISVNVGYSDVYSINRFINMCESIFGRQAGYNVTHPEFAFDLTRLQQLIDCPKRGMEAALVEHAEHYG